MSLPSGYKRLEYIKSDGKQYIKTGFVPNQDTRIVYDCYRETASAADHFFGVRTGNTTKNAFNFYIYNSGWRSGYNSTTTSVNGPSTGRYLIDKDKNVTYINGETLGTAPYASFASGGEAYLFAMQNVGSGIAYGSHRLYSCQIYDNGTIVRDFVPCVNASGEVGLYDLVTQAFFGNAGTGTFTAGPVMEPPEAPANLQHLLAVRFTWSAVDGATKYNVYRDDTLLGTTTGLFYVDDTAAENTEYTYAVSAVGPGGESAKTTLTVYTKSGYFLYKPYVESATFQ